MIIGVCGQSGSGKDTVADYLVVKWGFMKLSLADVLKRFCKEVYQFTDEQLWGPSEKRNAPDMRYPTGHSGYLSPRVALQTLGTEWGRNNYEDSWIDYALRVNDKVNDGWMYSPQRGVYPPRKFDQIIGKNRKPKGFVIPDIRFRNERLAIRARKHGYVVRVKRPGFEGNVGISGHVSEQEQKSMGDDDFDIVLNNDKSLPELKDSIDRMMKRFQSGRKLRMVRGESA